MGCLCVYSRHFAEKKALNGNVKHFVWSDVWRHRWPRGQIFNFIWKISSKALHCRLNSPPPPTCIDYRDIREGPLRPPPPAEGRGRTRPSRAPFRRGEGGIWPISSIPLSYISEHHNDLWKTPHKSLISYRNNDTLGKIKNPIGKNNPELKNLIGKNHVGRLFPIGNYRKKSYKKIIS